MIMKTYMHNGLKITEFSPDKLRLIWWDKPKNSMPINAFNAGFFGYYDSPAVKGKYTLPVANLKCDMGDIGNQQKADILSWGGTVAGGKVSLNAVHKEFKGKKISTLLVLDNYSTIIIDTDKVIPTARYAISGLPVIRGGADVSWTNAVTPQGWGGDSVYATYRNWIGVTDKGNIVVIGGKTSTSNYIATSETYKKLCGTNIVDLIALDGGGSFRNAIGGVSSTAENRRINNIGLIAE